MCMQKVHFCVLFFSIGPLDSSGANIHLFGIATCQRDDFSGRIDVILTFIPIPFSVSMQFAGFLLLTTPCFFLGGGFLVFHLLWYLQIVLVGEWIEADIYCIDRVSVRRRPVRGV